MTVLFSQRETGGFGHGVIIQNYKTRDRGLGEANWGGDESEVKKKTAFGKNLKTIMLLEVAIELSC